MHAYVTSHTRVLPVAAGPLRPCIRPLKSYYHPTCPCWRRNAAKRNQSIGDADECKLNQSATARALEGDGMDVLILMNAGWEMAMITRRE